MRALAKLLAAGMLQGALLPGEKTRNLRRQRTCLKNEISATLCHNLKGAPPVSDPFGADGRCWLTGLELPGDKRETVDACLRVLDFLAGQLGILERDSARAALDSPEIPPPGDSLRRQRD